MAKISEYLKPLYELLKHSHPSMGWKWGAGLIERIAELTEERDALKKESAEHSRKRDEAESLAYQRFEQLAEMSTRAYIAENQLAALKVENERLKAPLSAEEKRAIAFRFGGGSVENEFDRLIAARAAKEPTNDRP